MKERAALYARVSTARQEEEGTVASQLAALQKTAGELGLAVLPHARYVDEGYSGSRLDRPALDALRDAAADGLLDVVLVYSPDRLARNYVHQQVVLEELAKRGVRVHFVERPVGEKAEDKLLVQMQGVIAEYERAKILERTRRGKLHKVRSGQMLPFSTAPYGYRLVLSPDGMQRMVVVDEVEAVHVRTMYHWVLEEGLSARQVAKRLNAQGVRPRRARCWVCSSVHGILTSSTYVGMATYGRRESAEPVRPRKPGAYRKNAKSSHRVRPRSQWVFFPVPALVDEASQAEVKACLTKNRICSPRNLRHNYLLRTLVVCGECHRKMDCRHRRSRGHEYFSYACNRHDPVDTGLLVRCTARCVRARELDAVVWDTLCDWLRNPSMLLEEMSAWQESHHAAHTAAQEKARLEGACRQLQGQIERLVDAYQQGAIEVAELKARRERLEALLAATRARVEELAMRHTGREKLERLTDDLSVFAATVSQGLDALDLPGRQRLVRLLVERVVVTGEDVVIEHAVPLSGRFGGLRLGGGE